MIRKMLMFALTTGLASKLYRQYRRKQGLFGDRAPAADRRQAASPRRQTTSSPIPGSSAAGMEV